MASPWESPGASPGSEDNHPDVTVRPMKLKVLYTFDEHGKTNRLARGNDTINVRTVSIGEAVVGVIELKTCIQVIMTASPELIANLGQDYTVYAYDYSELDTPLVGQGMLSWTLASPSPKQSSPSHQSCQLITGRVCSNILGVFGHVTHHTLEVKLRLTPVPQCLQSEYLDSIERYHELSKLIPESFDPGSWMAYLKANPHITHFGNRLGASTQGQVSDQQRQGVGMEIVGRLLTQDEYVEGYPNEMRMSQDLGHRARSSQLSPPNSSNDCSRAASPTISLSAGMEFRQIAKGQVSRSASRASMRTAQQSIEQTYSGSGSNTISSNSNSFDNEQDEGPAKKRARVMKADWNGKSSLPNPDSLRVAASTAASIRMYRPIALAPSGTRRDSLEEPPRAPTPRPNIGNAAPQIRRTGSSSLRRESFGRVNSLSRSISQQSESIRPSVETGATSPEGSRYQSDMYSPINIPSSPPIMAAASPAPSSPALPALPAQYDSGFMSGTVDELFEDEDNEDVRLLDDDDIQIASMYHRRTHASSNKPLTFYEETPGPPERLPSKILPRTERKRIVRTPSVAPSDGVNPADDSHGQIPLKQGKSAKIRGPTSRRPSAIAMSQQSAVQSQGLEIAAGPEQPSERPVRPASSRALSRASSISSLKFPPIIQSDPIQPGHCTLQRSQSWTGAQHPMSDAPTSSSSYGPENTTRPQQQPRSGSGAKRKRAIMTRLTSAIEQGEIPPFCDNCGAIETPTWRKAWMKTISGPTGAYSVSSEEGGLISVEVLSSNVECTMSTYKLVKKTLSEGDTDWTEMVLCNPCGLWLSKMKCMRPEEKWNKDSKGPKEKKKRIYKPRKSTITTANGSVVASENRQEQGGSPSSEATTPDDGEALVIQDETSCEGPAGQHQSCGAKSQDAQSSSRSTLRQPQGGAALERVAQSSPESIVGAADSLIDVENLGTTRRLLFPSPCKEGEVKALRALPVCLQPNGQWQKTSVRASPSKARPNGAKGKENLSLAESSEHDTPANDDLHRLFEESLTPAQPVTTTHRYNTRSSNSPSKTPVSKTQTPSNRSTLSSLFSSAAKTGILRTPTSHSPTPRSRTRTPRTATLRSARKLVSPFSAHLQRVLSDAASDSNSGSFGDFDYGSLNIGSQEVFSFGEDGGIFDGPVPSSPPLMDMGTERNGGDWFSLYEDPHQESEGIWDQFGLPGEEAMEGET